MSSALSIINPSQRNVASVVITLAVLFTVVLVFLAMLGVYAWPSGTKLSDEEANAYETRVNFFSVVASFLSAVIASIAVYVSVQQGFRQHSQNAQVARRVAAMDRIDRAMEVVVTSLRSFRVVSKAFQCSDTLTVNVQDEVDGDKSKQSTDVAQWNVTPTVLDRVFEALVSKDCNLSGLSPSEKTLARYIQQAFAQLSIVAVMDKGRLFDEYLEQHSLINRSEVNGGIQLVRLRIYLFLYHFNRHLERWKSSDVTLENLLKSSGAVCDDKVFAKFLERMLKQNV